MTAVCKYLFGTVWIKHTV